MTLRCVPCVSSFRDATGASHYVAEIRYAGVAASVNQLQNRTLFSDREAAFEALVTKVRRLPELLREFEIVVREQVFQDVELAAQAIATVKPMGDQLS
jgi:hypothetical protein